MTTVGWGILGTGRIAGDFAAGLRHVPGAKLAAFGSRSADKAQRLAEWHGARAHGSYEALVADPQVDVVYVATPPALHKAHCLLALSAGKAVLCEKPFAMDAAEAQAIVAFARERKLFCMEAMWMHFIPAMQKAIALVREGAIGTPRMLAADFGYPTAFDPADRQFDVALGGGAMLDRGVYPLALAWRLFGEPDDVRAVATQPAGAVDEHTAAVLHYPGGEIVSLSATLTGFGSNHAVVIGTAGRLVIHEPLCRPDRLTLVKAPPPVQAAAAPRKPGLKERLRANPLARRAYRLLRGSSGEMHVPCEGNGLNYEAAEVARCLAAGQLESPTWPLEHTLGVMRSLDRIRGKR